MQTRDKLCAEADYKGQKKVIKALHQIFDGYFTTMTIDPHFDDYSPIDLYMSGTTKVGTTVTYAIETKDRNMEHTAYAEEGYILEDHKKTKLEEAAKQGYRPIYINTFTDNYLIAWDISKVNFDECGTTGNKKWSQTTVYKGIDPTYKKNKITLKNSQAQWIGKIKS